MVTDVTMPQIGALEQFPVIVVAIVAVAARNLATNILSKNVEVQSTVTVVAVDVLTFGHGMLVLRNVLERLPVPVGELLFVESVGVKERVVDAALAAIMEVTDVGDRAILKIAAAMRIME